MSNLSNIRHRAVWYKKIYYYMHAGQSVVDAIAASGNTVQIVSLQQEIATGKRMSDVCKEMYADVFSSVEISLIQTAENTGNMKDIFLSLSALLKAQHSQRQKVIASAVYPLIVICLTVVLLLMILMFIVPKIGPLFTGVSNLPISTRLLMSTSDHVVDHWLVDMFVLVIIVTVHFYARRYRKYVYMLKSVQRFMLFNIVYIKDVYILWHMEKWMQVMCICLHARISLHGSMNLATASISDVSIRKEFAKAEESVGSGNMCYISLHVMKPSIYRYIQPWISVIQAGEHTGSIYEVFMVAHEHLTQELQSLFEKSQKIIEPALIVIVGVVVMLICLSIILPMYQLTQSINM